MSLHLANVVDVRAGVRYLEACVRTISIQPGLSDETFRRVLLHEMCHINCPGHGIRFRRKLLRLAAMGETWAGDECVEYEEQCRELVSPTAQIRHALDD